jgi:D-3-phosphoglycerate dehydrogenase
MSWNILITSIPFQNDLERFRTAFQERHMELITPNLGRRLEEEDLLPIVHDIHGVISGDDRFTRDVLEQAPNLKVISRWGTGLDGIDRAAADENGIVVKNIPGAFTEPVADSVLGVMLTFARQIPWIDKQVKQGEWRTFAAKTLKESILGVIGVGRIGKAVIRRAKAFGMTILGNDVQPIADSFVKEMDLEVTGKDELYRRSDFISLNCDLNPDTRKLIGTRELELMKPAAVLINYARGEVVEQQAVVEALKNGEIAGAGLDVFEQEPVDENNPLLTMANVILSPHNGHSSPMARENAHKHAMENLFEGFEEQGIDI